MSGSDGGFGGLDDDEFAAWCDRFDDAFPWPIGDDLIGNVWVHPMDGSVWVCAWIEGLHVFGWRGLGKTPR